MVERGFCVLHLQPRGDPRDPGALRLPDEGEWEAADAFASERALTWWDWNPVFAHPEDAERYAWLAPVETEVVPVEFSTQQGREEDGWFDSFRAPYWFRVLRD